MKIGLIVLFYILISSCSMNEYVDNEQVMAVINSMEFSKVITEIEVDSLGNILDTISIANLKFDGDEKKRFDETVFFYDDVEVLSTKYFTADENLFYREMNYSNNDEKSIFETKLNKLSEIESAVEIYFHEESVDTIVMNYAYEFHPNEKKKRMFIHVSNEKVEKAHSEIFYDEKENPLFEFMIIGNDTVNYQTWSYTADAKLKKSIYTNHQSDTTQIVYFFGENKQLIKEQNFKYKHGEFTLTSEIGYIYNKSKNKIKSIETNIESGKVSYRRFLTEDL